jgi:hypothetical protein
MLWGIIFNGIASPNGYAFWGIGLDYINAETVGLNPA